MSKWSKDSWKNFKIKHIPQYNDPDQLEKALKKLEGFPPLVFAGECRNLKQDLAKASKGDAFLVQGGDCAESFKDFNANNISESAEERKDKCQNGKTKFQHSYSVQT